MRELDVYFLGVFHHLVMPGRWNEATRLPLGDGIAWCLQCNGDFDDVSPQLVVFCISHMMYDSKNVRLAGIKKTDCHRRK